MASSRAFAARRAGALVTIDGAAAAGGASGGAAELEVACVNSGVSTTVGGARQGMFRFLSHGIDWRYRAAENKPRAALNKILKDIPPRQRLRASR